MSKEIVHDYPTVCSITAMAHMPGPDSQVMRLLIITTAFETMLPDRQLKSHIF
jgi:hypothetical protein